jgi:hypothetical protein
MYCKPVRIRLSKVLGVDDCASNECNPSVLFRIAPIRRICGKVKHSESRLLIIAILKNCNEKFEFFESATFTISSGLVVEWRSFSLRQDEYEVPVFGKQPV